MSKPKVIREDSSVCRLGDLTQVDLTEEYHSISKTDEKLSLMCRTCRVSGNTVSREDGWKAFKIQDVLDFSLIGILAKISSTLAEEKTGIFVVSTYNMDHVPTREIDFDRTLKVLDVRRYVIKDS